MSGGETYKVHQQWSVWMRDKFDENKTKQNKPLVSKKGCNQDIYKGMFICM